MENVSAVAQQNPPVHAAGVGARILVFYRSPADDPTAVERVYHQVSGHMAGTEGMLGNQLMKDITDPGSYVIASDWVDMAAFSVWDKSVDHRRTTPLDPYQDSDPSRRKHFGIFEVVARY